MSLWVRREIVSGDLRHLSSPGLPAVHREALSLSRVELSWRVAAIQEDTL